MYRGGSEAEETIFYPTRGMLSRHDTNEVLSIGSGHFGALTQTHFFNILDETINQVEHPITSERGSRLTQLSSVACGPFYRQAKEDLFEPNLIIVSQSSEIVAPYSVGGETSPSRGGINITNVPSESQRGVPKRHPYQLWADTPLSQRQPRPDFYFDTSVKSFQDISDFSIPLQQVARIRPQRPRAENVEAIEDTIRKQVEKCDRVELISLAHELSSGDPEWDVPDVHEYILEELGKAALVELIGASPICNRIPTTSAQITKSGNDESSPSVVPIFSGHIDSIHAARTLLASISNFFQIYEALRNRTGKCIVPVNLHMSCWHPAVLQSNPTPTWDLSGFRSFDKKSAYQLSGLGALMLDSITIPFRALNKRLSAFTSIAQLTPSFCPVLVVNSSVLQAPDKLKKLPTTKLHDLSAFCFIEDPQLEKYPGHDFYAYCQHGDCDEHLVRPWRRVADKEYELKEPYVASPSSIWASHGGAEDPLMDVHSLVRSPVNANIPRASLKNDSMTFLEGSLSFITQSMLNTTLIDRAAREEWVSISDAIKDILEELHIYASEDVDDSD